ncbi:MAG: hypothetical protein IPM47_01285 [Sphingobacteriales bacterium]|nr:MAG: hypothetical protein IPM47_01285 [Sphingobacteriales bacterium]
MLEASLKKWWKYMVYQLEPLKKGVFVNVSEEDIEIAVKWIQKPNRGDNIRNNGIYSEE